MAFTLNSMFANGTTYRGLGEASTLKEDKEKAQAKSNGEKKPESYGLDQFDKKETDPHSYQAVYGKRPATFKDYFVGIKRQLEQAKPAIEKVKGKVQDFKANRAAGKTSMPPLSEAAIKEVDKAITADDTMNFMGDGSSVFQKSDAYGKAMMRSSLYQKSYNEKKYK